MNDDTQLMRNIAGNNQWPKSLLEKYHPREGYDGDEMRAITTIMLGTYGFFVDAALHDDADETTTLDSTLLQLPGSPIETLPMTLVDECVRLIFNYTSNDSMGYPMDRLELLAFRTELLSLINHKAKEVALEKRKLKLLRPPTYSGQFDKPDTDDGVSGVSYSTPCLGASVLAAVGKYVESRFTFTDEDKQMWFDTLYVSAMFWPMSGVNSIEAVVYSFEQEGYDMTKKSK